MMFRNFDVFVHDVLDLLLLHVRCRVNIHLRLVPLLLQPVTTLMPITSLSLPRPRVFDIVTGSYGHHGRHRPGRPKLWSGGSSYCCILHCNALIWSGGTTMSLCK